MLSVITLIFVNKLLCVRLWFYVSVKSFTQVEFGTRLWAQAPATSFVLLVGSMLYSRVDWAEGVNGVTT